MMEYYNRVFLSVDLSGSTKFKYSLEADEDRFDKEAKWKQVIKDFYKDFPQLFFQYFGNTKKEYAPEDSGLASPEVWKTQGDEIIFTSRLPNYKAAAYIAKALVDAVIHYRGIVTQYGALNLKASGWTADFPERNIELFPWEWSSRRKTETRSADPEAYELDFVGPSMDIGFRLGKLATIDRMPLSVELALLLTEFERNSGERFFRYGYDGIGDLKGVLGTSGSNYPILYVDVTSKHNRPLKDGVNRRFQEQEDVLLARQPILPHQISEYCNTFLELHSASLYPPFFSSCHLFKTEPQRYTLWRNENSCSESREQLLERRQDESLNDGEDQTPTNATFESDLIILG